MISSSVMPVPNRSVREQRPPIEPSARTWLAASPLTSTSERRRSAPMRSKATTNCSVVFTRMTPRLADRLSGFNTQGNSTPRAASTGLPSSRMRRKRGTGTPAAARHWRIWNLSRAAATAAGALARRRRRSAMAAAAAAVTSSTPTTAASGRSALHAATEVAAPTGSAKSTVRRLSGASASSVLGFSEAQTRSTPSVRAASTKSSVRYVRVGRSSSSRALPPTESSGLAGGVVGIRALRVVGRVEHLGDFGKLFLDEALDPRLERDVRGAAALAATTHRQVDAVVLDVDQLDEAAVSRHGRVDHGVDQLLHAGLEIGRGRVAHVMSPFQAKGLRPLALPVRQVLYSCFRRGPTGP